MSRYDSNGSRMIPLGILIVVAPIFLLGLGYFIYLNIVIHVPDGKVAILINKVGTDLENTEEIASDPDQKGIQTKMLGAGRHFKSPYHYDWQVIDEFEIPQDKIGVRIRLVGKELPHGQFLATQEDQKGIVPTILTPGHYPINPYVERVELHDPVFIPPGHLGVVTKLAGPLPKDPNVLLVAPGERGVQSETLPEGRETPNPYVERIHLIETRSQRYDLSINKDLGFPSKDGFWVRLDGIIEFRVKPEEAARVFVTYNEDHNGDEIQEEIVRKIILPNARSFCRLEGSNSLGREFIQGETRSEFQNKFQAAMTKACDPLGIEIIQALITNIYPPEPIAKPVREREIAKQQEKQYQQQILQQESEVKLAIEQELVKQKQALVQAEQEVVKVTTEALREQEVAVTKANEKLKVSEFALDAAKDEAEAKLARGKAAADVVVFQNEAEAAGWERAVAAFGGNGGQYAQFVLFEKLAQAYRNIMVNTADSPIMKIFESFNGDQTNQATAGRPPATRPASVRTGN